MANLIEQNFIDIFKNGLKITARTLSIKTFLSDRNLRRIDYKPYYQRNYVWDNVKQTFFIESVILGTEIPPLILFKSGTSIEVIDGRQRFETLKRFIENDIVLTQKGLMSLPALSKQTFNKLKDEIKNVFWNSNIRVFEFEIIISVNSNIEDKIKKEIFRRYNTGITPLTSVEIDSAKYDNDKLSDIFENKLKDDHKYREGFKKCFFPNELETPDLLEKMVDFKRRSFILSKFPISKYATGSERSEIISILYETVVNSIENLDSESQKFINQIKKVIEIHDRFNKSEFKPKYKLLYETILWALRIIDAESFVIDIEREYETILSHYRKNADLYSDENSFFYKTIIDRFTDTAYIFRNLTGLNFDIYLRSNDFKNEIKTLKQTDSDVEDVIKKLESLRINKPSPISKPVEEILSDVITNKYLIRPSYQRQEKISIVKASSIIESILLGIYLPPIFIYKRKSGVKEVVDGQQRLLSVIAFLGKQYRNENDELTFSINNSYKLKGLKILTNLNGSNYSSLSNIDKDKILDFVVDEIIIEENLNEGFEPTDLFIRLNQKPYPINNNSFEMWNSTVDKEIIDKIKNVTNKYIAWFFSKDTTETKDRADRMENEELITILSYLIHQIDKDNTYEKVLGLFPRRDRITCRLKNKTAITDFLIKLDESITEKELFVKSIDRTETLIIKLKEIFNNSPTKEEINSFFNVKKNKTFRRSYQDFYITWLILNAFKTDMNEVAILKIKGDIHEMLMLLRNGNNQIVDDKYFNNFINLLNSKVVIDKC
ncbi:MAG: hypothetical protein A2X12_08205 [Bacteroidetes bacterium GWE2_29_8]|nr:MAG: hypothetical protein A2X12_08205 [Bacteroidetes bacterium GWE2_29_8]OFY15654.1 MAG: hypothetical protein A2X02_06470 [Bacteroidetes bacterium GWF2_29_10]